MLFTRGKLFFEEYLILYTKATIQTLIRITAQNDFFLQKSNLAWIMIVAA